MRLHRANIVESFYTIDLLPCCSYTVESITNSLTVIPICMCFIYRLCCYHFPSTLLNIDPYLDSVPLSLLKVNILKSVPCIPTHTWMVAFYRFSHLILACNCMVAVSSFKKRDPGFIFLPLEERPRCRVQPRVYFSL